MKVDEIPYVVLVYNANGGEFPLTLYFDKPGPEGMEYSPRAQAMTKASYIKEHGLEYKYHSQLTTFYPVHTIRKVEVKPNYEQVTGEEVERLMEATGA